MSAIEYHRPSSTADAARLLGENTDLIALAGGQTILPSMRLGLLAAEGFVDLASLPELRGIEARGDNVRIGALTTHAEVANSEELRQRIPALADAAGSIGDRAVRNRGTLGGSLANNDPAADYPAAALGLAATIETSRREIAADDFFLGLFETALEPGELVTAVTFPVPDEAAYVKFKQPASRFAIVGVFVARSAGAVRVAVTGAGPCVFRAAALEQALTKSFRPEACDGITVPAAGLIGDLHGSPEYRAHLIPILTKRAVIAALA